MTEHTALAIRVGRRLKHEVISQGIAAHHRCVRRRVRKLPRRGELAVVVHVFYPEVWPRIAARLSLVHDPHTLVVTISGNAPGVVEQVRRDRPDAVVVRAANRGRDVLPFLPVARGLIDAGFTSVLKLHTKRSVHADDGDEFMDACLTELLPDSHSVRAARQALLDGIAVIGPASRYYPLAIHVWLNRAGLRRALGRIRPTGTDVLQRPSTVGFFAGTMFWARLDALADLLAVAPREFATEAGQIDGTAAHVLERLFTVVPEIDGRPVATLGPEGLRRIAYSDFQWPDWALRRLDEE